MPQPSIYYKEPVFRPPSEGRSLLIQATEGCTYRCSFCYPYMKKKFIIRKFPEIEQDLLNAAKIYGKGLRRIFLLDGNAFVMNKRMLIQIAKRAHEIFPHLERISAYAHVQDILRKPVEDLNEIYVAGVNMVYVGFETGDDELLTQINKKTSHEEIVKAINHLFQSKITLSGTFILGLAGSDPTLSKRHAKSIASLINDMAPKDDRLWYISALALMIPPGTEVEKQKLQGSFQPLDAQGILQEMQWIIEDIDPEIRNMVWRSNHASNYLPLKGTLAQDKNKLLDKIRFGLANPDSLRPEYYRGL